jgi:hypothetical protein
MEETSLSDFTFSLFTRQFITFTHTGNTHTYLMLTSLLLLSHPALF